MKKPKKIFASISFGVSSFIVAWSLGTALTATTGIPLTGGLLNGVLTAMVLSIGMLSTKKFGSAVIMWFVFSILASFTTTLGPQGIYKIVIGITAGFIWDFIYSTLAKNKRWGLYIGGILGSASIMFSLILALSLGFGLNPEVALERYRGAFYFILFINLVVTVIGIYLGDTIYRSRLCNLRLFKNLDS